jgi:hypothetical protein
MKHCFKSLFCVFLSVVCLYTHISPSFRNVTLHICLEIMCCLADLIINFGIRKLLMININFKHYLILKREYIMPHDISVIEATGGCLGNQG